MSLYMTEKRFKERLQQRLAGTLPVQETVTPAPERRPYTPMLHKKQLRRPALPANPFVIAAQGYDAPKPNIFLTNPGEKLVEPAPPVNIFLKR